MRVLSIRCLAMDFLLLLGACAEGLGLLTRYLGMDIHVTLIYTFYNSLQYLFFCSSMHIMICYKSYQLIEAEEYSY
jgi:hypothetical protein